MYKNQDSELRSILQIKDSRHRKSVVKSEIDSIVSNGTWELVDLPPGCSTIGCKWIFKWKLNPDGSKDKYKARLVAKGFKPREDIDYFDTYSPVARMITIRILIALAFVHGLIIHQMDVKITFLHDALEEEIYIDQPEGFVASGNERKESIKPRNSSQSTISRFKFVEFLNTLSDSVEEDHEKSQIENTDFQDVMDALSFELLKTVARFSSGSKRCLDEGKDNEKIRALFGLTILQIKAVQMVIMYASDRLIQKMDFDAFKMLAIGNTHITTFYGARNAASVRSLWADEILDYKTPEGKTLISPSGRKYDAVVQVYVIEFVKNGVVSIYGLKQAPIDWHKKFDETVLDFEFLVNESDKCVYYKEALNRVLRYLKGTISLGLHYRRFPGVLEGYSDASWIAKKFGSNGVTGYVFTRAGRAVSWKSSRQTLITQSTFEAELCAVDGTWTKAEWLHGLMSILPVVSKPLPAISVYCDC
ncbi:hypothetical protein AgCh_016680 [Apium graveolens]